MCKRLEKETVIKEGDDVVKATDLTKDEILKLEQNVDK